MKKSVKALLATLALCLSFGVVTACGGGGDDNNTSGNGTNTEQGGTTGGDDTQSEEKEIVGIVFNDVTETYDGTKKTIMISGALPSGVEVQYTNNEGTQAGTYNAVAVLSGDGYKTKTLTARLTISKATFEGLTFTSETFDYDATAKTIEVLGVLPQGTNVSYICEENENITNTATESGVYTITATITNPNYITKTLQATMKIQGEEDNRFIVEKDGVIYFANALDKEYLYSYDGTTLERVSTDVPYDFTVKGNDLYFRSKSLFGNSIKTIGNTGVDSITSVKGEYLTTDGTYFYYAVNGLTNNKSGVYKLDISGEEPTTTQLSTGKAKYLQYYDGYLYFADGANDYKLTKLSVSTKVKTLVRDEKITTLTIANGYLFYTVNRTQGDYIENYQISSGKYTKVTMDAGANLTVIGDKIYYVNVDLLTSYLKGDGIYYANAYPTFDNSLTGTLLVGGDTYSSLTQIGDGEIAYYRVSNQMLCVNNVTTGVETEVLDGFVAPETIPASLGSKTLTYNGTLYFLNLHEGKVLTSYNPATGATRKITSNKVSDFSIIDGYLYYNAVTFGVNNDLYRVNLQTGGEVEKISTNDCVDVTFADSKIYYVEQNEASARTAVHVIDENGTDSIMYSKGVNNLRYYNGYIYFIDGDTLYRMPTANWTVDKVEELRSKNVDVFEIDNGVIYFREVLVINKNLSKINVDGTGYAVIIEKTYDPVEIVIQGEYIYFYSSTTKADATGIYRIKKDGTDETKLMDKTVNNVTYFVSSMSIVGDNIYFVNYALGGVGGDSHLYAYSISGRTATKVV
ncbi:MAG: DUF5050 domain-containing protein [Clostridia bacterium]|nr:DUF5050 domain-containing protein [Clostridia bacterium]